MELLSIKSKFGQMLQNSTIIFRKLLINPLQTSDSQALNTVPDNARRWGKIPQYSINEGYIGTGVGLVMRVVM